MAVRTFMTFESLSSTPRSLEAEDPPAGRDLALLFASGIQERGLTIQEPVSQHDSYGWYFVAVSAEQPVWCMLQWSGEWLLITKPELPLLRRLFGGKANDAGHRAVCAAIHETARAHPDITSVKWFAEDEYGVPDAGAETPV